MTLRTEDKHDWFKELRDKKQQELCHNERRRKHILQTSLRL